MPVWGALAGGVFAALIFSWIAFGPGPRAFAGLGFLKPLGVSEPAGRVVFGLVAAGMWGFEAVLAVVGFRRLRASSGG
jgi:hypothetical protein